MKTILSLLIRNILTLCSHVHRSANAYVHIWSYAFKGIWISPYEYNVSRWQCFEKGCFHVVIIMLASLLSSSCIKNFKGEKTSLHTTSRSTDHHTRPHRCYMLTCLLVWLLLLLQNCMAKVCVDVTFYSSSPIHNAHYLFLHFIISCIL